MNRYVPEYRALPKAPSPWRVGPPLEWEEWQDEEAVWKMLRSDFEPGIHSKFRVLLQTNCVRQAESFSAPMRGPE